MKDRIKLTLGVLAVGGTILAKNNPEVQGVIDQMGGHIEAILGEDISGYIEKNRDVILPVIGTFLLGKWFEGRLSRNRKERLLTLEHSRIFAITTLDIPQDGQLYVENEKIDHIHIYI